MTRSRLLAPAAAVVAVALVLGVVLWLTSRDDDEGPASVSTGTPAVTRPVPVESYFPRSATVLALNYSIGVAACYGEIGEPAVTETPESVVVALHRVEPTGPSDQACIDIAYAKSVDITLAQPLGDRPVLDEDDRTLRVAARANSEETDPGS